MTNEELDRLAELEGKATKAPWRSMRAGNQYVKTRYMPTAECVGASEINELPRPWNPHAMVSFMKLDAAETSRFKDDDGDFLAALRNSAPALIALAREALAARAFLEDVKQKPCIKLPDHPSVFYMTRTGDGFALCSEELAYRAVREANETKERLNG